MTNEVLMVRPDAGKQHVRIDGKADSMKSRHGSVHYIKQSVLCVLFAMFAQFVRAGTTTSYGDWRWSIDSSVCVHDESGDVPIGIHRSEYHHEVTLTQYVGTLAHVDIPLYILVMTYDRDSATGDEHYRNDYYFPVILGQGLFKNRGTLASVTFNAGVDGEAPGPSSVKQGIWKVGKEAFYGCTNLVSVSMRDSVTTIGSYAFYGCSRLSSMDLPPNLVTVNDGAFSGCRSMTAFNIPETVTYIGEHAFRDCEELLSITIPSQIKKVEAGTFYDCSKLSSVTLPEGLTTISGWAFGNCTNLTSIVIPSTVTEFRDTAYYGPVVEPPFNGCTALRAITMPECTRTLKSLFPQAYQSISNVVVHEGVKVVCNDYFSGCTNLSNITLPSSLESIGWRAFNGCTAMRTVVIPDAVTNISDRAFYGCDHLASIKIPSGVTKICDSVFYRCRRLADVVGSSEFLVENPSLAA